MSGISLSTLKRLPVYLHYLRSLTPQRRNISATFLAGALDMGEVQVRKDLALVGAGGKPKTGYEVDGLIQSIESVLGCKEPTVAIIIGAGNLGKALLEYNGFADYGLDVIAAFDTDENITGLPDGKPVYDISRLDGFIKENNVRLGILTLPEPAAQAMADRLTGAGVKGIWNFTQAHITVPKTVAVSNENMAASLALLNMKMK